jgi:KDO2-lipid IV(A) lauroyltransferase
MPTTRAPDPPRLAPAEPAITRPLGRRIQDVLLYLLLRAWTALAGALPKPMAGGIGIAIGEFGYRVLRIRRRVVEDNLRRTLGQTLDRSGCDAIARGCYHHLGRTLLEYGRIQGMDRAELGAWVDVIGFEGLASAFELGRGVILTAGHLGNWELCGAQVSIRGYPLSFMVKEQRNSSIDRYLARTRSHLGAGLVYVGPEVRRVFRRLRSGEVIGMLIDQDAGPDGWFHDVLGRVASVQPGAGVFAQRTGAPIVPCAIRRLPDGRHQVVFEPPIFPDPNAEAGAEVERLNTLCVQSLERHIWRAPEQYYWVHRRWKTRPGGEGRRTQKGSLPQDGASTLGDLNGSLGARPL